MLKSKPIGWITAGTLVCLAGVALACRLRDGKEVPSEANASPWSAKDAPAAPLMPKGAVIASQATLAATEPPKPAVGEKVEEIQPAPATASPATETMPPPPPPSAPAEPAEAKGSAEPPSAVVPLPGAPAEEVKPGTLTPPPSPEQVSPVTAVVTPPEPVREPQTTLEKPMPAVPGDIQPVGKVEPVPTLPAPPAKTAQPEIAAKKSPPPTKEMPPETPPASAVGEEVGTAISGMIPKEAPASSPAPPPVAATCPPSEKPAPLPRFSVTAEPTYKVGDKGETLREIAKRTLGSEGRWTEIDKLNPELRFESIVPAGKVVRLPADARNGWNVPGGAETQDMPPAKPLAVRPLPVVRPKRPETTTKAKVFAPLTGTYSCKLDDRRGLVLPKEVCEQLDKAETVLLTPGPDQCLWLGTQASAARVLERVEKSGAAEQEIQTFRRLYYSQSEKAGLDGSGKLTISEKLAEYAGLNKEVVLIGIDDHFELWDAAHWQRYSQHKDASPNP